MGQLNPKNWYLCGLCGKRFQGRYMKQHADTAHTFKRKRKRNPLWREKSSDIMSHGRRLPGSAFSNQK
jgi:hypothetical protein